MINLMDEYIKTVRSNMSEFMKICLDTKYVKRISDEFIEMYTNIRYFGLIEARKGLTVKSRLLTELKKLKESLIIRNKDKIPNVELAYIFMDRCIAFNEKTLREELDEEINLTISLRKEHMGFDNADSFRSEINDAIIEAQLAKEKLLAKAETDKFFLRFTNFKTTTLRKVTLKHNIKFSYIYSMDSIAKVYNTGIINEDKMFVEFYLLTAQIIKDIEDANYRKQYVVDMPESLLEKPQKLPRTMEIINNSSVQDRLYLNINHAALDKNREAVYDLIRDGYKIVVTVDNDFDVNEASIQRLGVYQYILVNPDSKCYNELIREKVKNIIEI